MARVAWTTPALDQVREIIEFIAQRSPSSADKWHTRLMASVDRLEHLPMLGPAVPEFELESLRELFVKPYRILYVIRADTCFIVAVIHSHRDLTAHFRLEELEDDGVP
jgi:toxin ParE1/3/4